MLSNRKEMWAILHKPSGSWYGGTHGNLKLYYFQHEALLECNANGDGSLVWEPVKVVVILAPKPRRRKTRRRETFGHANPPAFGAPLKKRRRK